MTIKDLVRKLQDLEPAWFRANSWVNESVGAIIYMLPLLLLGLHPTLALISFNALSVAYEKWADPWGWNLDDVGQRAAGALLIAYLWLAL